jgi:hypothetical protein
MDTKKPEKKTVKRSLKKYRVLDRMGRTYDIKAQDYEQAMNQVQRIFAQENLNFPKDLKDFEECHETTA